MALLEIKKGSNNTFAHTLDGDYLNTIIDNAPNATSKGDVFNFKTKNGANIVKKQFIRYDEITYIDESAASFTFASVNDVWTKLISEGYFDGLGTSGGGSGVDRFDLLSDTFSYIGNDGKVPVVNQSMLKLVPTAFYNFNEFIQLEDVAITSLIDGKNVSVALVGGVPKIVLTDPPPDAMQLANTLGYFLTADQATQTTPLNYTTGQMVITNDGLNPSSTSLFRPYGVTSVWNSATNRFDFSELSIGDEIILRVDLKVTTTTANQSVKIDMVIGEGTADELIFRVADKQYKNIVTDEPLTSSVVFFLGNANRITAPGKLLFSCVDNDDATVKVGSFLTNIVRKGVNIVDVNVVCSEAISSDVGNAILLGSDNKLYAPEVIQHFKGKYTSLVALQTAHPTANAGDYGQVDTGSGSDVVNYNWDDEEGWVVGSSGSGATDTDGLPEGSTNLYHTSARVLSTILSGLSLATGGAIVSTDTVLQAFGKLQKQINDLTSFFVPLTRTITINGTTSDLSADRTFLTKSEVLEWFTGDEYSVQATGGALSLYGMATPTTVGSGSNVVANYAGTYTSNPIAFSVHRSSQSGAGAGSSAEFYEATQKLVANELGFVFHGKAGFTWDTGCADYTGVTGSNAATGNVNPSTLLDMIAIGADDSDSNLQFMHNDGSGTATKHDMGSDFAIQLNNAYRFMIWNIHGSNTVYVWVHNLRNHAVFQISVNTNLPASTVGLAPHLWTGNRATTNNVAKKFSYYTIQRQY